MRWTAGLRMRDGTIATPAFWYFGRAAVAGIVGLLILATALAGRAGGFPFANLPIRIIGQVSYGMYLWHTLVIALVLDYPTIAHWHSAAKFKYLLLLVLPITFLLGTLSYKLVEVPFMRPKIDLAGETLVKPNPSRRGAATRRHIAASIEWLFGTRQCRVDGPNVSGHRVVIRVTLHNGALARHARGSCNGVSLHRRNEDQSRTSSVDECGSHPDGVRAGVTW